MVEIFRAALDAIDPGQAEAAQALGMTPSVAVRVVLLPQALRIIIPPLGCPAPRRHGAHIRDLANRCDMFLAELTPRRMQ